MAKQIIPSELAELVTGLLIKPELLGELETPDRHRMFMEDIGRVVAEYCGGQVNGSNLGDADDTATNEGRLPMLSVSPCDFLPSLNRNVWSLYDPEGWDDGEASDHDIELGEAREATQINEVRSKLRGLMINEALVLATEPQPLEWAMRDWRSDDGYSQPPSSDEPYFVDATLGNQSHFSITNNCGEPKLSLCVEVNHGVPAVHIGFEDDLELHVHLAQGGLVLTPGDNSLKFEEAEADQFAYCSTEALRVL